MVIFILDVSGSMNGQKYMEAIAAITALIRELASGVNQNGFEVAIICFDDNITVELGLTKATDAVTLVEKADYMASRGGLTDIRGALKRANIIIDEGLSRQLTNEKGKKIEQLTPVVILLTDGEHNVGAAPDDEASILKTKAVLVTVAYGSDADEELLKRIATSEQHFTIVHDGVALRSFCAAVGQTITTSMLKGTDTGDAIGEMMTHKEK